MQSFPQHSRSCAGLGANEARMEPYVAYGERALQLATTAGAESTGRVDGSAGKQVSAARMLG
jgi:hypothetical protein